MANIVCIECGLEPLGNLNMPFTIVEGEQCCALHVSQRKIKFMEQRHDDLKVTVDAQTASIQKVTDDTVILSAKVDLLAKP